MQPSIAQILEGKLKNLALSSFNRQNMGNIDNILLSAIGSKQEIFQ
ncbi:hypothetical protein NIES2135_24390 [Leptolyngbya boryana NIES-2135]|uniref:Uncharacterized protein n=1 Tax=Leptolyngbya boryana NIES-2135 TaxID=1973484 RepID=A0A1Z4JFR3_LEPBY|nr:hypothetical protein NIES2135_24390 [Leptolyngbya boryana NIES-2135]